MVQFITFVNEDAIWEFANEWVDNMQMDFKQKEANT